ncbi:hypothetical protein [Paenibacillus woosongensis]|uniref:hypothetical protein n=1 Tax=Paenibacillus woosongensis TaxID=307580 RepID=UPI001E3B97C4|nr:hypothetical protein [Paenibacillus woosongensis]
MIIATKLHIPRPRTALVTRHRLLRRLHEGLDCELTLVTAPAGYGKTTLLSEWAMTIEHPSAWVSLDQGDNDRMRFWQPAPKSTSQSRQKGPIALCKTAVAAYGNRAVQ